MTYKAQASAEFLVLLGIAAFVLAAAVIVSSEQMGNVNRFREEGNAKNTVLDLSSAAKDVYSQGVGAKKQVYINLPSGYEAENSSVENRTIRLRSSGTDFVSVEDFNVHGTFPGTKGAHWVWVISEGHQVRIGTAMLSTTRNSIYILMDRDSNKSVSYSLKNDWDDDLTVSTSMQWTTPDLTMSLNPGGSFLLNPGDSQGIQVDFSAGPSSAGYYNGKIIQFADDGLGNNETLEIPVTVDVAYEAGGILPPLYVVPDFWGDTLDIGQNATKSFSICTNKVTDVTAVTFSPTSGEPGSWVGNTTPLGPIAEDTCVQRTLSLSFPNYTAPGLYTGTIVVSGEGATDAQDNISLYITVYDGSGGGGSGYGYQNQSMCNCPVG
ncbi:MAG: hypothetical protein ACXABY_36070, partial [Candidatus Thorarchaeota archaeon]